MKKDWRANIADGVNAKIIPPPDGDFFANLTTAQRVLSDEFQKHGAQVEKWVMVSQDIDNRSEAMLKFRKDGVEEMSLLIVVHQERVILTARHGDCTEMAYAGNVSAYNWEILRNLFAAVYNHVKQGRALPRQLDPAEFTD
jgi:hypothetical protein